MILVVVPQETLAMTKDALGCQGWDGGGITGIQLMARDQHATEDSNTLTTTTMDNYLAQNFSSGAGEKRWASLKT